MAIVYLEDGRLADEFRMGEEPYVLSDAIVMRPEDYATFSADEIAAMKQARYDNWIAIVTAPPIEVPVDETTSDPAV
jgi:hypothetical protein